MTFEKYVSDIESSKLLKRYQKLSVNRQVSLDVPAYVEDIRDIAHIRPGKRKEIVSVFPEFKENASVEPVDFGPGPGQLK